MTHRALLVDDESPARKELRFLLQDYTDLQIIGEATNAMEALELVNNLDYSVVFLDIDMPGVKGIELARQIRARENAPAIIFITAHEEYAVDAFNVNALDYLLKPINPKRLEQALQKVFERGSSDTPGGSSNGLNRVNGANGTTGAGDVNVNTMNSGINGGISETNPANPLNSANAGAPVNGQNIPGSQQTASASTEQTNTVIRPLEVVPAEHRGKTILLRPEEIIYIFTDKDNVFVKTHKESYLTRFTLKELEARLNPNLFFRSHRCYLVNIQRMRELIPYFNGTYSVVVDDHERSEVPVSRTQSRKLKEILGI